MLSLANARIGFKITISPAAALIGVIIITAAAYIVFGQLRGDLVSFNTVVDKSREIHAIETQLTLTHAHLYRFTSFAANEKDEVALARRMKESRVEIGGVKEIANAAGLDKALAAALGIYAKEAAEVIDMTEADTATALMMMFNLDEVFNKLIGVLTRAVTAADDARKSTSDSAFTAIDKASGAFVAGAAAVAALAVLIAFLASRSIVVPVRKLTAAMRGLADQDLSILVPGIGRGDEIGAMAGAVDVFKQNALHVRELEQEQSATRDRRASEDERVRREAEIAAATEAARLVVGSIGEGLERLAAGDLTFRLNAALPQAYERLRGDLNTAMAELQDLVRNIVSSTSGIRSGADEITRASDDLSRRTEQQAASLEETAASLDQITATVLKTAEGADNARSAVSKTREEAEHSGSVMRTAIAAMNGIERSSSEISQIIGVIDEIAFQTNLLALNAGIEAARAGDAGRGFAVVASEVRALAQRSAKAATEIKTLISTSVKQVGAGVKLVSETGQALDRIVTQVATINTAVSEIAASAREQAVGLAEVNTAINQMDQVTQQNAAMVEQSTAASHSLSGEADELVRLTERFQIMEPEQPKFDRGSSKQRPSRTMTRSAVAA